ncbi:hypothetical protein ACFZAG_18495 [Streptomyces sp. NPDC012403]|uniref:hypothetical protein n=1 Tax=unclassified Streptomyces TaxID=2593676 RepID=UPI001C246655|nr:hypothetical protein [Streptomyces sp. AC558_RSS880]
MPEPIRTSRRTWVAAWVVLCAAGLVATAGLNASSAPDPRPERPVSAECAEYVADIEAQLAEAEKEDEGDGVLAFSRVRVGTGDDCTEELRDHLRGDR